MEKSVTRDHGLSSLCRPPGATVILGRIHDGYLCTEGKSLAIYFEDSQFRRNRSTMKELLAIRRIFSLVDMITNTKFSNCPNVFKIGVVQQ